jgi:hypothetical protein
MTARTGKRILIAAAVVIALTGGTGLGTHLWRRWQVEPLPPLQSVMPVGVFPPESAAMELRPPEGVWVTAVDTFADEVFAYLMFAHYRGLPALNTSEVFLTFRPGVTDRPYAVLVSLGPDEVAAGAQAAALHSSDLARDVHWWLATTPRLRSFRQQAQLFASAYNLPVRRRLESLSPAELHTLLRRFIRYKSLTDPRIRKRLDPMPTALSQAQAHHIAADILAVADFYRLPLEFFLGIGAMENNYMNVRGDRDHSVWKRRADKGDMVLERRRGRVRVLNDSAGVWQITRETLRWAHKEYLKDNRDYSRLPQHLRPPKTLDLDTLDPELLTTYAGLILRDLLDRFQGDVALAVGAYNGGPGRPNPKYEAGVRRVAEHARNLMERIATLNGVSAVDILWMTP